MNTIIDAHHHLWEQDRVMSIPQDFMSDMNEDEKNRIYKLNAIECYQLEK